jgi:ABC-type branched-subunit amino acid transport system ATPase component
MLTFEVTSDCLVLENGEIALAGASAELRTNPASAASTWACERC